MITVLNHPKHRLFDVSSDRQPGTQFKLLVFLFVGILFTTSCKKFLEEKSNNSLVTPDTIKDLQAILDDGQVMNKTPSYGEASTDDYYLLPAAFNSMSTFYQNVYKWIPFDYKYQNDWSFGYHVIYNANLALEEIEKIPLMDANRLLWNNVKGSALFYRAYTFLNLAWIHAKAYDPGSAANDLGIVLRLKSDFNLPSVRANVEQTYSQLISDAKSAIGLLPDKPQHPERPSKEAAYGLLARAYLSMRQYDSAGKYANLAIQSHPDLFNYNNAGNGNIPFPRFNAEIIFYSEMNPAVYLHAPNQGKIDTLLYSNYTINDLRKTKFFRVSSGWRFKGTYASATIDLFTGIATDEMYLIRAEHFARKGMATEAMKDLNTMLETRWANGFWVPFTATSAMDALNKILTERRKQLLMRGLRWPDIKRLNKEGANITQMRTVGTETFTLPPDDNRYALPLPIDIIQTSGIQQN